jgi:hypothetical protein
MKKCKWEEHNIKMRNDMVRSRAAFRKKKGLTCGTGSDSEKDVGGDIHRDVVGYALSVVEGGKEKTEDEHELEGVSI